MSARRRTRKGMRALLPKSLLALVSLLAAALLAELMVAVTLAENKLYLFPRYVTDARYGEFTIRRNRPDTTYTHTSMDGEWEFRINDRGFRSDENYAYEKRAGVYRVLVLGDSHTLGYEVRQDRTFSHILERYLESRGLRAEVLNAGVSGFGTAEQLVFLREEGVNYEPDAVVLGFYANDYVDNLKSDLYQVSGGALVLNKKSHLPGVRVLNLVNSVGLFRWLSENSYAFGFAMNTAWDWAKVLAARQAIRRIEDEAAVGTTDDVDAATETLALLLLKEIRALCEENGATFVLVDIPHFAEEEHQNPDATPRTSLRPALLDQEPALADHIVTSEILAPMRGVVPAFLPNGYRHISLYTHLAIGLEIGRVLTEPVEPASAPVTQ